MLLASPWRGARVRVLACLDGVGDVGEVILGTGEQPEGTVKEHLKPLGLKYKGTSTKKLSKTILKSTLKKQKMET